MTSFSGLLGLHTEAFYGTYHATLAARLLSSCFLRNVIQMATSLKDKAEMWLAQYWKLSHPIAPSETMFCSNVLQAMCSCIKVAYHFLSGEAILSLEFPSKESSWWEN